MRAMKSVVGGIGPALVPVFLVLAMAGPVGAVSVTYQFTAIGSGLDGPNSRTATGMFTYSANTPPSWNTGPFYSEFSAGPVLIQFDGMTYSFDRRFFDPNFTSGITEIALSTSSPNSPRESFTLSMWGARWDGRTVRFNLILSNPEATVFDTYLALPEVLDLSRFSDASVFFHISGSDPASTISFSGRIDSLTMVPEPATLANVLVGAALVGGGLWRARRRKVA